MRVLPAQAQFFVIFILIFSSLVRILPPQRTPLHYALLCHLLTFLIHVLHLLNYVFCCVWRYWYPFKRK